MEFSLPIFLLLSIFLQFHPSSSIEFVFNGFNSSDLLLYGNAAVHSPILTLTNHTSYAISRALFPQKIPTKNPNSSFVYPFSTSFIFSMTPSCNNRVIPGHGIVFVFVPATGLQGTTSVEYLGLFNFTNNGDEKNHVLGIEFDVVQNEEFKDINANHIGIDLNSLTSKFSNDAGFWPDDDMTPFKELKLNNGENYQVWIDYKDSSLNVTMARVGTRRPQRPLLNVSVNLSEIFLDEMYAGFTSSTGKIVESHRILGWSFSNTNLSLSNSLITTDLPSFVPSCKVSILKSKKFIAGIVAGSFLILCSCAAVFLIKMKKQQKRENMEEWELEFWPHRIQYGIIEAATERFSEKNVIGIGGNGKVYKGNLPGGGEIAVKRISHENEGIREFLAEISSIGRLKHRNLVGLRGWCKRESGSFLLAYEFMENGSLDKWIFDSNGERSLNFEQRIKILKDVASGILYLHEGWESRVLHRDIKASNVLLDGEMNARLGDFGLARVHAHGHVATTTGLVGTVGYLAPEQIRCGRVSAETDVYGFGILMLEVMTGRRPVEGKKPGLVEWVWRLRAEGELLKAVDEREKREGDLEEVEKVLHLGMLCTFHEPAGRPTMREVVQILEKNEPASADMSESASLLQKMESRIMSCEWKYSRKSDGAGYVSFEDIKNQSISYSTFTSWTDSSTTLFSGR